MVLFAHQRRLLRFGADVDTTAMLVALKPADLRGRALRPAGRTPDIPISTATPWPTRRCRLRIPEEVMLAALSNKLAVAGPFHMQRHPYAGK